MNKTLNKTNNDILPSKQVWEIRKLHFKRDQAQTITWLAKRRAEKNILKAISG